MASLTFHSDLHRLQELIVVFSILTITITSREVTSPSEEGHRTRSVVLTRQLVVTLLTVSPRELGGACSAGESCLADNAECFYYYYYYGNNDENDDKI